MRWHPKAAENGNAASQVQPRNVLPRQGAGVPKDEAEGVESMRKSADQGNAAGQFWLGASYYSGTGVAKDTAEALRWYRKAGDQGYAAAQYNLGQAYNLGNGVEKDTADQFAGGRRLPSKAWQRPNTTSGWLIALVQAWKRTTYKRISGSRLLLHHSNKDLSKTIVTKSKLYSHQLSLLMCRRRIRKFEEAHPATQTASLNSLPSVQQAQQQKTQTQDHSQDQQQARAPHQLKPVYL